MGQFLSATVLVTFVASALAFNVRENSAAFEKDTIQIGVIVEDLETSVDFYTNVIGMEETGGFTVDADLSRRTGLTGGKAFDVTVLKLKDSPHANEWKIMSFEGLPKVQKQKHIQDRVGMQYITIFVDSVDPYLERLKAHDVKLLGDTPVTLGDGRRFLLFKDPNGIFVEIIGA